MTIVRLSLVLVLGFGLGIAGEYWYANRWGPPSHRPAIQFGTASAAERPILYYRDPGGAPYWSEVPKKDPHGRDYLPVYDDEEPSFDSPSTKAQTAPGERKILYYRNPMGLADTSPVPKKDSMGMSYIPVYEGDEPDDGNSVKISLDRVQRTGVRSEAVRMRTLVQPIRAVGTVKYDERRQTVVTMRSEGYIEDLFVNATGQFVRAGEPLFRVYSRDIQVAQIDLSIASGPQGRATGGLQPRSIEGPMQRLRNLGVPEGRIEEVRTKGTLPRTLDWPAPITGTVVDKRVINGQRVQAGDELYRIVDLTQIWVIADVAEADLASIKPGMRATITFRAYPIEPVEGAVTFIYPDIKAETRTARVRIELPNPAERLRAEMYADIMFQAGADEAPVLAVPNSAVIDSGTQQIVLVSKSGGRFEPRNVKLGRRGEGYREVLDGLSGDEEVVTTATFLIDAESNLRTALKTFTQDAPSSRQEASR